MQPAIVDNSDARTPWMNRLLVLANVAVFLWQRVNPAVMPRFQLTANSLQLWMFLSYAFLHVGWWHLIFNMVALMVFGPNLNRRLGNLGYLGFYLGGAAASAVGFVAAGGEAMAGASGAVGAVMGGYVVLCPKARLTVFVLIGTLEVSSFYFVTIFLLYNMVMAIATRAGSEPVAYEAHVAGILFGILSLLALIAMKLAPREPAGLPGLFDRWRGRVPERHDEAGDARTLLLSSMRVQATEALRQGNPALAADLYLDLLHADPEQFLSRQAQLDVAAELASQQRYPEAARSYEQFLRHYPAFDQIEEVQLMLGVICSRYLKDDARARELLVTALPKLKGHAKMAMAQAELDRLDARS
ncbi:MAG: rhomboid family intramembrane serine protease [Tepidisphaeraceae bacterium]